VWLGSEKGNGRGGEGKWDQVHFTGTIVSVTDLSIREGEEKRIYFIASL